MNSSPNSPAAWSARLMRAAIASAVTVACLTGCAESPSADSPDAAPSADATFTALVDEQLAQAREGGASDAQIGLLEQARAAGVMTHEIALEGARNFMSCLEDVGVKAELAPTSEAGDYPAIEYRVHTEDLRVADQCLAQTYDFVDTVYQLQPAAHVRREQALAEHGEDFRECLEAAGISVPDEVDNRAILGGVVIALEGMDPYGASEDASRVVG